MAGIDAEFNKLMHESVHPLSAEPLEPLNELVLKHMDRLEIDRKQTLKVRSIELSLSFYCKLLIVMQYAEDVLSVLCMFYVFCVLPTV